MIINYRLPISAAYGIRVEYVFSHSVDFNWAVANAFNGCFIWPIQHHASAAYRYINAYQVPLRGLEALGAQLAYRIEPGFDISNQNLSVTVQV